MNLSNHSFRRNSKGIGTVFGMVFFLLIVMIVFASLVIVLDQNTGLEQTMIQTRQMDIDKANEELTINLPQSIGLFSNFGSNNLVVNCILNNTGTLPVTLKRLWVQDETTNTAGNVAVSAIIKQGNATSYTGGVTFPGPIQSNDNFRFWFESAKGNQFTLQQDGFSQAMFNQYLSEILGDFLPDYHSVQWGVINQVGSQFQVSSWTQGWVIPVSTQFYMAWKIDCTYHGTSPITLDQNTMLFFVPSSPRNGGGHALNPFMSYIVSETTSGTNAIINQYPGNEITVQPSTRITLYFAVLDPGATIITDNLFPNSVYQDTAAAMMSLTLYGKSPSTYAQSFPLFAVLPRVLGISLSQTTGPVGTTVTVSGNGFTRNSPITIRYDSTILPLSPTSDSNGRFSVSFNIPSSTAGDHVVNAIDASGNSASTNFRTTASISIFPTNGPVGNPITISGQGFAALSTITITFGGNTIAYSPNTDASGSFSGTTTVPSTAVQGSNFIVATDSSGNSASTSFTVTVIDHFAIANIGTQSAGSAFGVTITAQDALGNTVAGYSGTAILTYSAGTINPSSIGPFVAGVATASVTVATPGNNVRITVSDGSITGQSNTFNINPGALDHFSFNTINSPQGRGTPFSITITAQDQYGNTVTSYTGQNNLEISSGTISPTSTASFSSGIWTGSVTASTFGTGITISTNGGIPTKYGTSNAFDIVNQVTFVSAGTGVGVTGNPAPVYPAGLQANDLLLMRVTVRDTTTVPSTPAGFALLYGPDSSGSTITGRQWIFYKFALGSESGSITVTITGGACKMAQIYAFRNVALSSFYEGGSSGSGTSSAISGQSITTTGTGELAVSMVFVNDDNAVGSFSGGVWTEPVSEFPTTAGNDGCIQLQIATMTSPGTVSAGTYTMSASDPWGVRAFALKPV